MVDARESTPHPQPRHVTLRSMIAAARRAPLTTIAVVAYVVIFFGISSEPDRASWAALAHWGGLPSNAIYDGGYWALVSSAFVHADAWHLLDNFPWLWLFGSRFERAVGAWRWIAFVVGAAFVARHCN